MYISEEITGGYDMERVTEFHMDELAVEVNKNGIKLIVIAMKIEEEQWQLSVLNEYGIFTNWTEFFPTAQLAIETGINAIENEGVDSFVEIEGFEYLFE